MEITDDWSPEAKFEPSTHYSHIKCSEINIGKLTEKTQVSIEDIPTWCRLNGTICSLVAITRPVREKLL